MAHYARLTHPHPLARPWPAACVRAAPGGGKWRGARNLGAETSGRRAAPKRFFKKFSPARRPSAPGKAKKFSRHVRNPALVRRRSDRGHPQALPLRLPPRHPRPTHPPTRCHLIGVPPHCNTTSLRFVAPPVPAASRIRVPSAGRGLLYIQPPVSQETNGRKVRSVVRSRPHSCCALLLCSTQPLQAAELFRCFEQ